MNILNISSLKVLFKAAIILFTCSPGFSSISFPDKAEEDVAKASPLIKEKSDFTDLSEGLGLSVLFLEVLRTPHDLTRLFKINSLADIVPYIDSNTLVFFDIDDTLIFDPEHNFNKQTKTEEFRPVEGSETVQVFKQVQALSPKVMGLTARSYKQVRDKTLSTLSSLSMTLIDPFPDQEIRKDLIKDDPKSGFWDGIIFTHYRPKGDFVDLFLEELKTVMGYIPEKVVFVDDLEKNCLSVKECLEKLQIPGIVFLYTGASEIH